jgi:hypothetical protein
MTNTLRRSWLVLLVLGLMTALLAVPAAAQGTLTVTNDRFNPAGFPNELEFTADLRAAGPITRAEIVMQLGSRNVSVLRPAVLTPSGDVTAARVTYNIRGDAHIPPGTTIRYRYRAETAGGSVESEPKEIIYLDPRFQWSKVSDGPFSVYYYGGAEARARRALASMVDTNRRMGPLLGVTLDRETKGVMYNSNREMIPALSFVSETTERELVREGVAYWEFDLFLTLGSGSDLEDTVAHEFTHLLVGKAAGNRVDKWVNEGLAVVSQRDSSAYQQAVQQAIRQNRLLPLRTLDSAFQSTPENIILAYGQSGAVMRYLIDTQGQERLQRLLGNFRLGAGSVAALRDAYGKTVDEIDAEWRRSIGVEPAPGAGAAPQAQPSPTAQPKNQPTAQPKNATTPQPVTPVPGARAPSQPTPVATPAGQTGLGVGAGDLVVIGALVGMVVLLVGGIGVIAVALALRNRD